MASGRGQADGVVLEALRSGDAVLMLRHALAPGTGDPDNFKLPDCSTQRNLDSVALRQAQAIGAWFRANGIVRAGIYSRRWCRCLETARLLDLGRVRPLGGLNSFFDLPEDRTVYLAALRKFLLERKPSGEATILVTHQVTITAITGRWSRSGEGVVVEVTPDGEFNTTGSLTFGQ